MYLADDGHLAVVDLLALVDRLVGDVVFLEDAVQLGERAHPAVAVSLLLGQHQHLVPRVRRLQQRAAHLQGAGNNTGAPTSAQHSTALNDVC